MCFATRLEAAGAIREGEEEVGKKMRRVRDFIGVILVIFSLAGCGSGETGGVAFTTWGEAYIEEGIPAAEFEDGWSVKYKKFLVVLGHIRVAGEDGAEGAKMGGARLVNHVAPGVKDVAHFDGLEAKPWTEVSYELVIAKADTELGIGATEDDRALMAGGGYNVYVEGDATSGSTTKSFSWGFGEPTLLARCKGDKDGKETDGVLVTSGGTDTVELTIHGDHLFYDDLQSPDAKLRFDAIASADADKDGTITLDELSGVKLVAISEGTYGTGSAAHIDDLRQFVEALSRTVGHFRGEGECAVLDP
jgi:hypothetical protein